MSNSISIVELTQNLSDFLDRVAYRHEHFQIRKGDRIMAELRPVSPRSTVGDLDALLQTAPALSEKEAKDFENDLAEIRRMASEDKGRNPWD